MKPKISIVTVSFNTENTIENTIKSVLNQTQVPYEYIIVDGKSTDNTPHIINSYSEEFKLKGVNFRWISERDNGIYEAFNKGVGLTQGNWISFLGADDVLKTDALESYTQNWPLNEVDLICSNVEIKGKRVFSSSWNWRRFRRKMTIAHVGALHAKKFFENQGLFNSSYQIAGDYELLLRAKETLRVHKVEKITVEMGLGGISNKQVKKVYQETTRAKNETGGVLLLLCIFDYYLWMLKYFVKTITHAVDR